MPGGAASDSKPPALLKALIFGLLAFAPLAIGTVHTTTRAVLFTGTALLLGATLLHRIRSGGRLRASWPLALLLVAVGATLLQLVPMPADLLAVLSPRADEAFRMALDDYTWRPVTLDIGGTVAELAKLTAYAGFFFAVATYASRGSRRRNLVLAVIIVADVVALIGILQAVLGAERILLFYQSSSPTPSGFLVRGTFVNPNHFGALVGLAAPCALVLGMREPKLRALAFGSLVLLNLCVVFSLSRSTIVSAPLAQVLAFVLERRSWRGQGNHAQRSSERSRLAVVIAAVAALAVGATLAADQLIPELRRTEASELASPLGSRSKLALWKDGADLARIYPWVGHGRGAFEQAFTEIYAKAGVIRATYLENGFVQMFSDWGVPIAILLALLLARSLAHAVRNLGQEPLAAGALAALVGLALHDTVDFAADIPGVAFPALVLAAVLFARSTNSDASERIPSVVARPWHLAGIVLPIGAVAASLLLPIASVDAHRLTAMAKDPAVPTAQVVAEGERLVKAHPADYFVPAVVARRLAEEQDPRALTWLNHSMFLNPRFAAPHLMAAELLAAAGRKQQALLEYRLAAAGVQDSGPLWDRVYARYTDVDDLLLACPKDVLGLSGLGAYLGRYHRYADADTVFSQALQLDPENLVLRSHLVNTALERGAPRVALERVRALVSRQSTPSTRILLVRVLIASGELDAAASELAALHDRSSGVFRQQVALGLAMARKGDFDKARKQLNSLTWQTDPLERAGLHDARAEMEKRAGNKNQADWEQKQAAQLRATRTRPPR